MVQVDPTKTKLTPPGTKRLKLKCDMPLSTSAFNFNLCRYITDEMHIPATSAAIAPHGKAVVQVDPIKATLKAPGTRL
jgi:hypothetical protein